MTTSIPVLGTAVVNGANWLVQQILTIDFPVDRYIVVNNSGSESVARDIRSALDVPNDLINSRHVIDLPGNIGCAGAWNLVIKSTMMSPYWMICNHDIAFCPGLLERLHGHMQQDRAGVVHGSSGDFKVGTWDLFAISDAVISSHGLFDENFYPAYVEDLDYLMRLMNQPVKRIMLDMPYLHGSASPELYGEHGSQTIKTDPHLRQIVDRARWINENRYMVKKWGDDWRWVMIHDRPWNAPDNTQGSWTWDLEFVRSKYTGF
jgi:hypothetical protein